MDRRSTITADLEQRVQQLLQDEAHLGHPLREALGDLWHSVLDHIAELERITALDGPGLDQEGIASRIERLSQQFERQLNHLERVVRISDRYQSSLKDLNTTLRRASTHDPLTGIANRVLVEERCHLEDGRSERTGSTYALAVLDVDHFKRFNDRYGHDLGDQVLKLLAQSLSGSLRQGDLCARWGGEEFLMLLSDTALADAERVVRRMLQTIRQLRIPQADQQLAITVSIGVAEHRPGESFRDTFRRADQALLQAKRQGRDRFELQQREA